MSHAGASDGLYKSLLDNAVFYVERELTCSLLRCAPADTVGIAGDILNLFRLNALRFLGDGRCAVMYPLCNRAHVLNFC